LSLSLIIILIPPVVVSSRRYRAFAWFFNRVAVPVFVATPDFSDSFVKAHSGVFPGFLELILEILHVTLELIATRIDGLSNLPLRIAHEITGLPAHLSHHLAEDSHAVGGLLGKLSHDLLVLSFVLPHLLVHLSLEVSVGVHHFVTGGHDDLPEFTIASLEGLSDFHHLLLHFLPGRVLHAIVLEFLPNFHVLLVDSLDLRHGLLHHGLDLFGGLSDDGLDFAGLLHVNFLLGALPWVPLDSLHLPREFLVCLCFLNSLTEGLGGLTPPRRNLIAE